MAAAASRILIDATMARRGGGFTYLVNLLPRLAELAPERRFRLLARSASLRQSLPKAHNLEVVALPDAGFARRLAFSWLSAPQMARRWRADVYFAAGDIAPLLAPCPVIASFRNPNVFTSLDQGWYAFQVFRLGALRRLARVTARSSARILFVSHDSARWIGESIGLPPAKRAVIHHGIDPERFSASPAPAPYPRPYLLSVSSIYRYKNFVRLIEAWTLLARRRADTPDLVIVGDDMDPDYSAQMRNARAAAGSLQERICIVGAVPYAEVPAWYRGAQLFAFPSYLETFGHPLLEAMASDVPVVAADIPVSREVAGDSALYAPHDDVAALADALACGLDDAAFRERARARGRERVAHFTWDASARAHLALFDESVATPAATQTG
ncbi:MAG: glycosyltransferase family 4 protein [Deltaproteobacteria bacterium]|nr:glycosyltransferase family 4 protein [Deltaproteobacteria bacterium]MBW2360545.1 glycosyltransferase family 4 protein [Deltaproteobacteria bacterium]